MTYLVYKVTLADFGDVMELDPGIPINAMPGEDMITPRISVGLSIPSCIRALNIPHYLYENKISSSNPIKLYVYYAKIDSDILYQPKAIQVPDCIFTNEMWLFRSTVFKKLDVWWFRKHMHLPYTAYSRYAVTRDGYEDGEVMDRITAETMYGNYESFSIIELDPEAVDNAVNIFEESKDIRGEYYNFMPMIFE